MLLDFLILLARVKKDAESLARLSQTHSHKLVSARSRYSRRVSNPQQQDGAAEGGAPDQEVEPQSEIQN
jgi:hypothetical protein